MGNKFSNKWEKRILTNRLGVRADYLNLKTLSPVKVVNIRENNS